MTLGILSDPVSLHIKLDTKHADALRRLGIVTVRDLLWHFPARYEDFSNFSTTRDALPNANVTLEGVLEKIDFKKTWKRKIPIAEGLFSDGTGKLKLFWFHQPYIAKMLTPGSLIRVRGKLTANAKGRYIGNPSFERIPALSAITHTSGSPIPVYPETLGITSLWFHHHITKLLDSIGDRIPETLPALVLKKYKLPSLLPALRAMHTPHTTKSTTAARKRFSFEEVLLLQLLRARERAARESSPALVIAHAQQSIADFAGSLSFTLTKAQTRACADIARDLERGQPMARLLEGDVGSGKTAVAAAASRAVNEVGYQVVYMAPTEILARQHFASFSALFGKSYLKIGLATGSECKVYPSKAFANAPAHISRAQLEKWTASGDISILIGTHALIAKGFNFKKLGLIIVDEQHRFGVSQRAKLARTNSRDHSALPHFLSMTATPIPRTLALTIYGDLDLSVLDELPKGRITISTSLLTPATSPRAWTVIRDAVARGEQAFIICPRIEEKDDDVASVLKETKHLRAGPLAGIPLSPLHGGMPPKEKERIMGEFASGKISVLISTTVVEVGVDIPNATVMVIEGAERYGLAQLHQLRGRVGRGSAAAQCFLISGSTSAVAKKRLKALEKASSGFALAELDLELRGAGELSGGNQWGVSDIGMDALKNLTMVSAARDTARELILHDPQLEQSPMLHDLLALKAIAPIHLE